MYNFFFSGILEIIHLCTNKWLLLNRNNYLKPYHHHHHAVLVARISLTLSRHFSRSFIASGGSSVLHPVSSQICWMYVRAGRPAFARPYVGVHRSTSLMSSSQLLQQCPACLVRLTWIVFVMGGRWPYSWCLVGCCLQDLFTIARRFDKYTWNQLKLLVLDRNTRNHKTVWKLLLLDWNNRNHITLGKLLVLDRNTRNYINVQIIIMRKECQKPCNFVQIIWIY